MKVKKYINMLDSNCKSTDDIQPSEVFAGGAVDLSG